MGDRQMVRVKLFDTYEDDTRWTVPDAVGWLSGLLAKIPEEFRDDSTFHVEIDRDYYDSGASLTFEVYYDRPETDEEMAGREAKEAASRAEYEAQQRSRELYELQRLKAKYGD